MVGTTDFNAAAPRRRSEESRRAILRAVLEIATENGYGQLSIEAIATRAGVGKQTIYRWWPSKGAVVMDAFLGQMKLRLEWTQEGNLETELIAQVTRVHSLLSDQRLGGHIAGLIGEAQRDPAVAEKFQQGVVLPYREVTLQGLNRAQWLLTAANTHCPGCGKAVGERDDVHHLRYPQTPGTETDIDLVLLCRPCHDIVHGSIDNSHAWRKADRRPSPRRYSKK